MRPLLEKVLSTTDASWSMLNRRLESGIPFEWHHHPEFELTLTLNSRGQRFIGDHVGSYDDGDLVLVGSNLPHTWSSSEKIDPHRPYVALVLWFRPDWVDTLAATFPELAGVTDLFSRAGTGLSFSGEIAARVRPAIEALFDLGPIERFVALFGILAELTRDNKVKQLSSPAFVPVFGAGDRTRIDRVLDHIHRAYRADLKIADLAETAALSPSGLNRLFYRHTHQTISDYVKRLRIGQACSLLSSTSLPIAHIAHDIGYASLANFNRQFKAIRSVTPKAYRLQFKGGNRR